MYFRPGGGFPAAAAAAPRREAAAPPVDLRPPYDCVVIAGNEAQRLVGWLVWIVIVVRLPLYRDEMLY